MMLTEKQYWELISTVRADGEKEPEGPNALITAIHVVEGIEIRVYEFEHKDIVLIFTYKHDEWMQGFAKLFGDLEDITGQLLSLVEPYIVESKTTVSGYGIGGVYAVYASAKMNLSGVVFDAPGQSRALAESEFENVNCRNIIAYGSLVPAFGHHPEPLIFAEQAKDMEGKDIYAFDSEGSVLAAHIQSSPFFRLMNGVNNLIDNPNEILNEMLRDMAIHAGMEEHSDQDIVSLYYVLNYMELEQAGQLLPVLLKRIDYHWDHIYQEYREACQQLFEAGVNAQFEQQLATLSIEAIEKGASYAETLYSSIEGILSILFIQKLSELKDGEEIESTLPSLALQLSERVDQLSDRINEVVEKGMVQLLSKTTAT